MPERLPRAALELDESVGAGSAKTEMEDSRPMHPTTWIGNTDNCDAAVHFSIWVRYLFLEARERIGAPFSLLCAVQLVHPVTLVGSIEVIGADLERWLTQAKSVTQSLYACRQNMYSK